MIERSCPLCGPSVPARVFAEANLDLHKLDRFAFASRKLPEYMHPRLLECRQCGLLYGSPVLSAEWLQQAYFEAGYDSAREAEYAAITYVHALRALLRTVSKPSKVLDIGAGDGAFLRQLLTRGYENLDGVEPSAAPLEAAHPEIRPHLRQDVFRADDYPPDSLGLVTCFQTLEHVPDPLQLVRGVHRLLRSDGAFAIAVHNRRAWTAHILGRRSPIYDVEHLQLFCPRTAGTLLARAGFRRIQVKRLRNRYPLRYWLRLFPLPPTTKGRLLQVVERNWLGRANLSISAGNLFCWGRKE